MSDPIPSREEVSDAMEDGNWAGAAFAVAIAYVKGRLVDREAMIEERFEWESKPMRYFRTDWEPIVVAAIGEDDD